MADPIIQMPDGLSLESCIFVNSAEEEYEWLNLKYPGFQLLEQSVQYFEGRPFDVLEIRLRNGVQTKVHFDISEFFDEESSSSFDNFL